MKRLSVLIMMLCGFSALAHADDFESVRKLAGKSSTVKLEDGLFIEGILVSDRTSLNMADNPNVKWNQVDLGENFRTMYIQSEDGRYGFRLISSSLYNPFPRFAKVRVDLSGAELLREDNPERYTVRGIGPEDMTVIDGYVETLPKKLHISELKDEDIYTYVSVQDLEFAGKHGSFANVYEPGVQQTWLNAFKKASGNADSWPTMLKDGKGDVIYMLVNTKCTWRRKGDWLPQGKGEIAGVLVHSPMRRHGGVGPYSIRPAGLNEIRIAKEPDTSYETVVEWNWNRNYECALDLEGGLVEWIVNDVLKSDRIHADIGKGYLSTTCGADMTVAPEYDSRSALDGCEGRYGYGYGEGSREYGAVCFISDAAQWYEFDARGNAVPSQAVLVETSTAGCEGSIVTFDFTWMAGMNRKIAYAWGFPAEWQVAWSEDGSQWHDAGEPVVLRPMYWNDKEIKEVGKRNLSYDAALGFTEHSVRMPAEVLGKEKLFIRIAPCSDVITMIPADPAEPINRGRMREDFSQPFHLNIGKISLQTIK